MKNKVSLSFCIWNFEDVSHDEITNLLNITPTKIYVKGQKRNVTSNALIKENGWLLNSPLSVYSEFEDQMDSLLALLEPNLDALKLVSKKYYCEFSCAIFIYFNNDESTPSMHLTSQHLKFMNELNIEFDTDLYCLFNE